jgi:manganese-dependent inorganic pyrophosphatase
MNFDDISREIDDYVRVLDKVSEANNYVLVALYVTDIIKNGSYVIFNTKGKNIMEVAYQNDIPEGYFIRGCVSRKKHVVPQIMSILEN